jgi:hypothetical protein
MYSESQAGKGIWGSSLPINPTEAFKLMLQSFDTYNKFINASLDFLELSSKGKTEDIMGNWKDLTSNLYKDYFEAFSSPMKMFSTPLLMEKISWEEPFNAWSQLLKKSPLGVKVPFEEIEDYVKFAKDWQKRYTKLYNTLINCQEKTANAIKSGLEKGELPDKILLTCIECNEDFIENWLCFLAEYTEDHFRLLKSSMTSKGQDTAKKETDKKESAKSKAGK